jgi:hypothetical protein
MQFEVSRRMAASPAAIFARYADVAHWPQWDEDLKAASIDGPFASGSPGVVEPKSGPKSKVLFVDVQPNRGFAVECKLPLCQMRFEHRLEPQGNTTLVTHGVVFRGALAWLFGRLIGAGMRKTLPHALSRLEEVVRTS